MEHRMIKLHAKHASDVTLKVVPGHFATNHSHINYYIDMTTLKTRQSEAQATARALVQQYVASTVIDTILCLDGTQVVGSYLATELTRAGFNNSNSQMILRDNLQPMVNGKHVLILMASVTTGLTINKAMEAVQYYGGQVVGLSAIFSAVEEVNGMPVNAVFHKDDVPEYQSFPYNQCPHCKAGMRLEALVNSFGYSKL